MFCVRREGREPGREASSVSVWERALAPGRDGREGNVGLVGVVVAEKDDVVTEAAVEDPADGTVKC